MTARFFPLFLTSLLCAACGRTSSDQGTPGAQAGGPAPWPARVPSIHAGADTSCSLDSEGRAVCWGRQADTTLKPPEPAFRDLSMRWGPIGGTRADFTLRYWNGSEDFAPPAGKFGEVAIGHAASCALDLDGHALCWGDAYYGAKAPPGIFKAISGSVFHYCALRKADGHPLCWGANDVGESNPPDEELTSISASGGFTCGLRPNGTAVCWGLAPAVPEGSMLSVETGGSVACFIHPDQHVSCSVAPGSPLNNPIAANVPPSPFAQVAIGGHHACGLRPDGSIACWANNFHGQATPPK